MKVPVVVLVRGGVAYTFCDPTKVDVRVVDVDNINAGGPAEKLPAGVGFEQLLVESDFKDCVTFEEGA